MNAKKLASIFLSAAIVLTSTQSFAETSLNANLRYFDNKSSEEIQKESRELKSQLDLLLQANSNLDKFLYVANSEGLFTEEQQLNDRYIRGGVSAALVMTPIAIACKIGWCSGAFWANRDEIAAEKKLALEKAHAHYQEFFDDLAKAFDTTTSRGLEQHREELLTHLSKSSAKYVEATNAARSVLEDGTKFLYSSIDGNPGTGRMFLNNLALEMRARIYDSKYQGELHAKLDKIEKRFSNKKKLSLLFSAAGAAVASIYYRFSDREADLTNEDKEELEGLRRLKSNGNTYSVGRVLNERILKRAQIGKEILKFQERQILLEAILMIRGNSVD